MKLSTVYIGYYQNIVLCASTEKSSVKKYLKQVRGLHKKEYTIYSLTLNEAELESMYADHLLEEYDDGIWLTARDIRILENDVYSEFVRFTDMVNAMKDFTIYAEAGGIIGDMKMIKGATTQIMNALTKGKSVNALRIGFESQSPIFSKNLKKYLSHVGYWEESTELRETFLTKLNDEKS